MSSARRESLPSLSERELSRLLARDVSAVLACVDAGGYPRMVPCWFLWDGGSFYVTSEPGKFHVRCLTRDARASICVAVEEIAPGHRRVNRQVKAVGRVELFEDDGTWWRRIRARYLAAAELADPVPGRRRGPRVVLKLTPERLSAHGGGIVVDPAP